MTRSIRCRNLLQEKIGMIVKIYATIWAIFLFAAAVLLITGHLTGFTAVGVGFSCLALVFSGMMIVMPLMLTNHGYAAAIPPMEVKPTPKPSAAKHAASKI